MANTLQDDLARFRQSGDFQPCLDRLNVDGQRPRLLALQHALQRASTRAERDTLEDIAFFSSPGAPDLLLSKALQSQVRELSLAAYGRYLERFVDIPAVVTGILSCVSATPPMAAIVAAVGLAAQRAVGVQVPVEAKEYGTEVMMYTQNCEKCGGSRGGRGNIYCAACIDKVRELYFQMSATRTVLDAGADPVEVSRQILLIQPDKFGCPKCRHQPVKACACQKRVRIPSQPHEGEILCGNFALSDDEWFGSVYLMDGEA